MSTSSLLEDHITCSICFEIYENPYALKCLHTYCLGCINQMRKSNCNLVECPECRIIADLNEIRQDFKIQSLIDLHQQQPAKDDPEQEEQSGIKCDMCSGEGVIKSKCEDCNKLMCLVCDQLHTGVKKCKSHKVVSVDSVFKTFHAMCKAKQKELKEQDHKLCQKVENIEKSIRNIKQKQSEQLKELQQHKQEMIQKTEKHHKYLEQVIKNANNKLIQNLTKSKKMCENMKTEVCSIKEMISALEKEEDVGAISEETTNLETKVKKQMEDIKAAISAVKPSIKSPVHVSKGAHFKPEKFVNVKVDKNADEDLVTLTLSYSSLATKTLQKINSIVTGSQYFTERVKLINDHIYCARYDGIKVFSKDCTLIKSIKHDRLRSCCGVAVTHTNDIVVSCRDNQGLHLLDSSGNYKECISEGSFSDVCCHGKMLYAWDWSKATVIVLEYGDDDCLQTRSLKCNHGDWRDQLCVNDTGIYISSYHDRCLQLYNLEGKFILQTGEKGSKENGEFDSLVLCDVDVAGNVLVCDVHNNRLQVYNRSEGEWNVLTTKDLYKPFDAVVDPDGVYMWIATINNSLTRYIIKDMV